MRHRQATVWVMAVIVLAGCRPSYQQRVTLVRAHGTVTLDGKPLDKAIVIFEAPDGSFSYAQTNSKGRYDLRFDSYERGVTPGKKTVRISMNRRLLGLNSNDEGAPDDRAGGSFPKQPAERVPPRFNTHSELSVEVTPDRHAYDFDLRM
jgi:hypothetical protein